jgi:hypothetical protein
MLLTTVGIEHASSPVIYIPVTAGKAAGDGVSGGLS